MTADLRSAATVLVLRDSAAGPEVFMVRRHQDAAFMAGAHVFPGGALDRSDRDAANPAWCDGLEQARARMPELDPLDAAAFHVAAVRELFEEAGALIAHDASGQFAHLDGASHARFLQHRRDIHAGVRTLRDVLQQEHLRLAAGALAFCAHWVTPPLDIRRFDTRFFVARMPPDQQPVHDDHETTESRWTTPSAAIVAAEGGAIVLPPPTWAMLRELEPFHTVDEVLAWARARQVRRREPKLVHQDGTKMLILPGDPTHIDPDAEPVHFETRFVWAGDRWRPQRY